MAGFNPMPALAPGATPGPDGLPMTASDMDAFNACMTFDESMLDPVNIPQLPFTPAPYDFDAFSTTFEDPFSYPARPFENNPAAIGRGARNAPHVYPPAPVGDSHTHTHTHGHGHHDVYDHMGEGSPPDDEDDALDNKLLSFGAPIPGKATLLTDAGQFAEPHMTGELYGMFFVAEDVFGADSNTSGRPLELTCYRRNLWQISGQVTLPRQVVQYMDDQGRRMPVAELAASITAVESIEGRVAEMITIPWRGSNAPPMGGAGGAAEETKAVSPPPVVPLDFVGGGQEVDGGNRVSVPVAWKRLQFKHATANNGRRKGLQQHYVVQINLLVKSKVGGEYVKVAEVQSGPVIVRGRSPRNFDSRKEVPLGDKRPLERRNTDVSGSSAGVKQQLRAEEGEAGKMQRFNAMGSSIQSSPADWPTPYASTPTPHGHHNPQNQHQHQHANKKMALTSPSLNRPPVPSWGSLEPPTPKHISNSNKHSSLSVSSSGGGGSGPKQRRNSSHNNNNNNNTAVPLSLSLSEDERSPSNRAGSNDSAQSPQQQQQQGQGQGQQHGGKSSSSSAGFLSASGGGGNSSGSGTGAGAGGGTAGGLSAAAAAGAAGVLASPMETTEDMLYEYFPLSLDDWMPPVDAIYRPHVVHHTIVPPEVKAQQVRSKAKRYFVAAE
ncbi:hypothetical protein B0J18DRAFT_386791 [Chaetomium sp. MPI-SDFR-AT-0129]|nr:hypothetical protein B0J18DRAFT_386791 [Chaetomium sp. MPI-SDFR-AT-0129]